MNDYNIDYGSLDMSSAITEAERCKACRLPLCTKACPLNVNVKKILAHVKNCDYNAAYNELVSKNALPEYTAYLCTERPLCIANCAIRTTKEGFIIKTSSKGRIDIPGIEKFIISYVRQTNSDDFLIRSKSKKRVAIIGSNSAAISCAIILSMNGFNISIYEKDNLIAQDLRLGLLNYKIANQIVEQYEEDLVTHGVQIYKNQSINADFDLLKLRRDYDYLVLTSNFEKTDALNIQGETKSYTLPINDVLRLVMYTKDFVKLTNRNEYFKTDDNVIIIGSSSVSLDTARIVHKFVKNVNLTFVNSNKNVGVRNDELEKNQLKSINIRYNIKPIKIEIIDRKVRVTFRKTKNVVDEKNRPILEDIFDSEWSETCDHLIIDSITSSSLNDQITKLPGISFNKDLTVVVDEKYVASNDGSVYCCGELIGSINSILDSIREGMKIAKSIIAEAGGDLQDYKDELNEILRKQNANSLKNSIEDDDE
ncbi:MAG: FAD-dependent oxidoreductase [archaeon]|nr:FAD-dependent oxidoreductase [archaeon]